MKKRYFLGGAVVVLIMFIGIFSFNKLEFIKLAFINHYSIAEYNQLFISSKEKKMIMNIVQGIDNNHNEQLPISSWNSYQINDAFYLDYIDQNNSHIIIFYRNNICTKYIGKSSSFVQNTNNRTIKKTNLNFQKTVMQAENNLQPNYIDPLQLEEKNQMSEAQEIVWIEKLGKHFFIQVQEKINDAKYSREKFIIYPKNTLAAAIAIQNQITISTLFSWFSSNFFDPDGMLLEDQLLCVEKYVSFQYGRQVLARSAETQDDYLVIDLWEVGEQRLYLQTPFILNKKENCIGREMILRPEAMDLCDEYFQEKAVMILEKNNKFIENYPGKV